jgi:hypothetical protein
MHPSMGQSQADEGAIHTVSLTALIEQVTEALRSDRQLGGVRPVIAMARLVGNWHSPHQCRWN